MSGRAPSMGRTVEVAASGGTVSYGFDAAGRRTSTVTPVDTVTYGHSGAGWVTSLADNTGTHSYSVDGDGRVLGQARPNGVDTTWSYDTAGRLTEVAHTGPGGPLDAFSYTLDANGNRTSVTSGAGVESYTLDAVQRLTQVVYPDGETVGYGYDPAGNRTIVDSSVTGTVTSTYDAAGRSVADSDGTSYTHDAAGFLISTSAGDAWVYDAYGRNTSSTIDGATDTAVFDGDGRRVELNGVVQVWDRTGLGNLVADGSTAVTHGPTGVVTVGGAHQLTDGLGSVRASADASGTVTSTAAFDVFGATRTGTAGLFGFTGEQTDPSGQVHLRARNYLPDLARFGARDTVQPNAPGTQGWNLYSYVANNPTTWVDPSGNLAELRGTLSAAATQARFASIVASNFTRGQLLRITAREVARETLRRSQLAILGGGLVAIVGASEPEPNSPIVLEPIVRQQAAALGVSISDLDYCWLNWRVDSNACNGIPDGLRPAGAQVGQPEQGASAGLIGAAYEDFLAEQLGGVPRVSYGGREFDVEVPGRGGAGSTLIEAKSGGFWDRLSADPRVRDKFRSTVPDQRRIALDRGSAFIVYSNVPIPVEEQRWLASKGIPFRVL